MAETITSTPSTPVSIDNPEQASSNFYWTYLTTAGSFNLQTTIRGILNMDQIKAHIKSVMEMTAHVSEIGGLAKQVGKGAYDVTPEPMPAAATPNMAVPVITTPVATVVQTQMPVQPVAQPASNLDVFETKFLRCDETNGKMYFKVKGGKWVKFGVTVWPEVLTAVGVNSAHLESGKDFDFIGFKATAILKPDGKPEKIIKLEKVA